MKINKLYEKDFKSWMKSKLEYLHETHDDNGEYDEKPARQYAKEDYDKFVKFISWIKGEEEKKERQRILGIIDLLSQGKFIEEKLPKNKWDNELEKTYRKDCETWNDILSRIRDLILT